MSEKGDQGSRGGREQEGRVAGPRGPGTWRAEGPRKSRTEGRAAGSERGERRKRKKAGKGEEPGARDTRV